MEFRKYQSLENHYREKYILKHLQYFPELGRERFVVLEKLDGANIQLHFENGVIKVGKRSQYIGEIVNGEYTGDDFYGIIDILNRNMEYILNIEKARRCNSLRLYGEVFGPGVQNRVDYGSEKKIAFFDMEIDGELQPFQKLSTFLLGVAGGASLLVPILALPESFEDAIGFDVENRKTFYGTGSSIEGVVIRPQSKNYAMPTNAPFVVKKKSIAFAEKMNTSKKKIERAVDPKIYTVATEFEPYINKNRVLSVFSKEGEIEDPKDIGRYIQLVVQDAQEDFLGDNPQIDIPDNMKKHIFNKYNKKIVDVLREYL